MDLSQEAPALLGGRYLLEERLGQGGMGVVFRARDIQTDKLVALKLIDETLSSDSEITRFKREFRAATRLNHPSCVGVYDIGHADGHWFFTMEFVAGGRLQTEHKRPPAVAVAIGLQVLAALDHMHSKQIVHRDIKPQNILVVPTDRADAPIVKVCDFGIAKATDLAEDAQVGDVVGSLRYLAPEQTERGQADVRADLYSVGVVLYELLSGQHPVARPTVKGMGPAERRRYAQTLATPLEIVAPDVPPRLAALVMRLLEKSPQKRPFAAADVCDELSSWLRDQAPDQLLPPLPPLQRKPQLGSPRFVGRSTELGALRRFIDGAFAIELSVAKAAPRTLFLSGLPGAGKSRLMAEALRIAEADGAETHVGTCPSEGGAPYEALSSLLETQQGSTPAVLSDLSPESGSGRADETAAGSQERNPPSNDTLGTSASAPKILNSQSLDDLDSSTGAINSTPVSSTGHRSHRMTDDVEEAAAERWKFKNETANKILEVARTRPVLLLLEDAQWSDAATLELLGFLLRAIQYALDNGILVRIGVLVSFRPAADHRALAALQKTAESQGGLVQLELMPLSMTDIAELVASMLMVESEPRVSQFAKDLAERTDGNPLFVAEVLHVLLGNGRLAREGHSWNIGPALLEAAHLPATLRDAIGDRASRLWVGTKRMLEAAAVIGRRFDLATLEATTGLENAQLLDCLDEAIREGFVEEQENKQVGFLFSHDRFREAIYERLPQAEATALHAAAAHGLEARFRGELARAGDMAYHFDRAGLPAKAYRYGAIAADQAMKSFAFTEAADFYRKTIDNGLAAGVSISPGIVERFGDACLSAGLADEAEKAFVRRLESQQKPLRRSDLLRKLGEIELTRGNVEQATNRLEEVLVEVHRPSPSKGLPLYLRTGRLLIRFLLRTFFPTFRPKAAKEKSVRGFLRVAYNIHIRLAEIYYYQDISKALHAQASAIDEAEKLGPGPELVEGYSQQGFGMSIVGQPKLAARCFERALSIIHYGGPLTRAWNASLHAYTLANGGQPIAGEEEITRFASVVYSQENFFAARSRVIWAAIADFALFTGKIDRLTTPILRLKRLADETHNQRIRGWAYGYDAFVADKLGKFDEAIAHARLSVATLTRETDLLARTGLALLLARLLAARGQGEEAVGLAMAAGDNLMAADVRHATWDFEPNYLAVAAFQQARGALSGDFAQQVEKLRKARRQAMGSLRSRQPGFNAGLAALHAANGDLANAAREFTEAAADAEALGILGEKHTIHLLAAEFLEGDARRPHADQAAALERLFATAASAAPSEEAA